jgi:hypothetical protein
LIGGPVPLCPAREKNTAETSSGERTPGYGGQAVPPSRHSRADTFLQTGAFGHKLAGQVRIAQGELGMA